MTIQLEDKQFDRVISDVMEQMQELFGNQNPTPDQQQVMANIAVDANNKAHGFDENGQLRTTNE